MNKLDKIVSLCKRRGFVYPTSEIYGGLISSYDYGPLGTEMLRNIRNLWWQKFIHARSDMIGLDSQILLHPQTWVASGHASSFVDPVVEDKVTHLRYRADHIIEAWLTSQKANLSNVPTVENMDLDEMADFINKNKIPSPHGNPVTKPKKFNLLFETKLGVVEDQKSLLYLRGETAQGIFTNFKNVVDSNRVKLPFGIGQIGKSFRNEITSGQFVFRTLEMEQAEIEYFFDPDTIDWKILFESWRKEMWHFITQILKVVPHKLRWRKHSDQERSFYSKETYDLDYEFPFGWKELWGIAYRTDYDLKQHSQYSSHELVYIDRSTGKKIAPHVIEPALGINRLFLLLLDACYFEEDKRLVLALPKQISPYKVAIFPLLTNKAELVSKARDIFDRIKKTDITTYWDDRGNIGKRYLTQDEIGTPWCVTIDYETLSDDAVTLRDRDSTLQKRIKIAKLIDYLHQSLLE